MPDVSVIIPTYNRSKLLKEAIESVLKQTYTDFEVLVIDDGSTDDTASVVRQITDKRIRYLYEENRGESSARNLGLIKTQGQYVAFLDSDDLWPSNYLETMVNKLHQQNDYALAYACVMALHENRQTKAYAKENRYRSGWLTRAYFEGGPCIMPSATLIKKEILQNFYFDEDLATGQDNDFFLRLSVKTPFLFVSNAYIFKRVPFDTPAKYLSPNNLCNGILSMERFVYRLGGLNCVPQTTARRVISHKYHRAGKRAYTYGYRHIAIILFRKAIYYWPQDLRLYVNLAKAWLLNRKDDKLPDWQMPKPLPDHIKVTQGM